MNAHVLCPGPSLSAYRPGAEVVTVGVNRAAVAFSCDYAVMLDSPALKRYDRQLAGEPRLLTRAAYRPRFSKRPGPTVEELAAWCPLDFAQYSATAAIVLAGWMEAEAVSVYGADWTDEADWDGYSDPDRNRGSSRWDRERRLWWDVVEWLDGKGCSVSRVTNEQAKA